MNIFSDIFIFVVGLVFGSFANVLIYRLPKNISLLAPASFCPHCQKKIFWYDNIPLLGFLLLGGRCRFCKNKISLIYPAVELITALTFLAIKIKFWPDTLAILFWCLFFLDLLVIAVIDYQTRTIPDVLSLGLIPIGLIFSPVNSSLGTDITERIFNSLAGIILNGLIMYLIALLAGRIFQKEALGGGDIKLLSGLGAFLGFSNGLIVLFAGALAGSLIILGLMITKKISRSDYFPFGPFLVIGSYLIVFVPRISGLLTFV